MNRTLKSNNRQSGGDKLGEGSFGCVVKPAVQCSKRVLQPNTVSKIVYNMYGDEEYEKELDMLKSIKHIDPNQKYFVSIIDECELNPRKSVNRHPKDIIKVSFTDDDLKEYIIDGSEPAYISKMKPNKVDEKYCFLDAQLSPRNQIQIFGGYPLDEIKPDSHHDLYIGIHKYYKSIIKNLLIGMKIMHQNRIVHRDIKEYNILAIMEKQNITAKHKRSLKKHKRTNIPLVRYIDFGLSEVVEPNKDYGGIRNFSWSGTLGYIPIDFVLISEMKIDLKYYGITYLEDVKNKINILERVKNIYKQKEYNDFYNEIHFEQSLISQDSSSYNRPLYFDINFLSRLYDRFVTSLKDNTFYKILKTDYQGILYKADIFALGVVLAYIRKYFRLQHDNNLQDLIKNMIRLSPSERYSILDCLKHPFFKN